VRHGSTLGYGARQAFLALVTVIALLPVYVMVSAAFRTQGQFLDQPLGFPTDPTLHGFRAALSDQFPRWLFNSFVLSGGSVVLCMAFASMAAYGLVRFAFPGRDLVLGGMIALMVVPPVVLLIPLFALGVELNLINTFQLVIVIYVGLMLPFSIYMLWAFFRTIPSALLEAATVDGASSVQVFLRVVLPLSGAPLVTLAVVNVLWAWNELLFALIFLQSDTSHTVMAGLTAFQNRYTLDIPVVMAGLSLATLPIVAVYLIGQRYFTRGLVAGAIKGE
jgi:ABC-type glycerol-3-phosphate transport system permease component